MNEQLALDFSKINTLLTSAELFTNAAETHGILSGFICGGRDVTSPIWKSHFNDVVNEGQGLPIAVKTMIDGLYATIAKQCSDQGLGFTLLLPDDEQPLEKRVEAVAQWAQGFLTGFGLIQPNLNKADSDIQEVIRDIRDISQLELTLEDDGEESEVAYVDIAEYLRVAAMLCFDYFQNPEKKPTLH